MAEGRLGNGDVFSFFQSFGGNFWSRWIIKFVRSLNEKHLRFIDFKKGEIIEKTDAHAHTTSILNDNSIRAIFFSGAKFNNTSRNNWKPLFEVNYSKNYTSSAITS